MDVNATAAALLGLLRDGPATGYALHTRAAAELGDFWTVTRSQLYRELAAMATAGLVAAGEAGARDARPYSLTEAGRTAFERWLHSDPGADVVRIPLLLRLAFADGLDPGRRDEMIAGQRAQHAAQLALYESYEQAALQGGARGVQLATLRFGLAYERAVLGWCDALAADLS